MRKFTAPILLTLAVLLLGGCATIEKLHSEAKKILTVPDRGKYVGETKNGVRHGSLPPCQNNDLVWTSCVGSLSWGNGNKYVGEWEAGEFHGLGTATYADGRVEKGIWKNGRVQYGKRAKI